MNRESRANIPTSADVLDRMHALVSGVQRSALYGNIDLPHANRELTSVIRNLVRLEGQLPDQQQLWKSTINSLEELKASLDQQTENTANVLTRLDSSLPNGQGSGRNKYDIDVEYVQGLMKLGFSVKQIARGGLLGGVVHPNTIYQRLRENNTPASSKFADISDDDLRSKIHEYNRDHPNSGAEEICAWFKRQGLTVQRDRYRHILAEVDRPGTASRWSSTTQRRQYSVPMANSLWHVDSHHSLIRWGIVVHGAIDGKSRLIAYLRASTCNTAKAACSFFVHGVQKFGVPSRVRADHGTENVDIGRFMNTVRGEGRGSFITGKSVHNQRIERLCVIFFQKFCIYIINFFFYMEDEQILDINNNMHIFCLQYVYAKRLDLELKEWQSTHNNHRVRTEQNRTPQMLWLQSKLTASETSTAAVDISENSITSAINDLEIHMDASNYQQPRIECPINNAQYQRLKETIDVYRQSESHGMDIFGEVVNFLSSVV